MVRREVREMLETDTLPQLKVPGDGLGAASVVAAPQVGSNATDR